MRLSVERPTVHHIGVSGGKDSTALLLWAVYESGLALSSLDVTFSDTGNEHPLTYDYVRMLSEKIRRITWLKPERDFYALANHKQRFPSVKARFCTTELKMKPCRDHVWRLRDGGNRVILLNGVRAAESLARSQLPEREEADWYYGLPCWRPLLGWSISQVWEIHARHGVPPNPLYAMGAKRVGCYPCIMSRKSEIANIAANWPERIEQLALAEKTCGGGSTFFKRDKTPVRYRSLSVDCKDGRTVKVPTIADVVRWAQDGEELDKARAVQSKRQMQLELDTTEDDSAVCASTYGACE